MESRIELYTKIKEKKEKVEELFNKLEKIVLYGDNIKVRLPNEYKKILDEINTEIKEMTNKSFYRNCDGILYQILTLEKLKG